MNQQIMKTDTAGLTVTADVRVSDFSETGKRTFNAVAEKVKRL